MEFAQPLGDGLHAPDAEFPAPKGPDYVVRYSVERIGGAGP
jgi:hypothetical protein